MAWQTLLSEAYYTSAKWNGSLLAAQFAAELAPFNPQIQRAPAELFLDARVAVPLNLAVDISNRVLSKDPYAVDVMIGLADFYAQLGDLDNALRTVYKAELLAPKNFDVLWAKQELEKRFRERGLK